ncbi:glycosyltransferase [Dethiosulfatarculus sandiegensis]|uniref:glycosyltransferase n=1 Tax=Dethiosulfatarculus sandiegensis TaxID=1429043 RepID=UPI0018D0D5CE|nr:glycosyltransferase [Dethiosulfatarculus sandiegensis]
MRILIMGSDNLAVPLRNLGCRVWTMGPEPDRDLLMRDPDPDWAMIQKALKSKGITPDALLVTDDLGSRKLPTGLWSAPLVTAFYGIDSPINGFWQPFYARLFDLAFLDQLPQARELGRVHGQAHWLPVGINPDFYLGEETGPEEPGICFVGVVEPSVRPKRSALLDLAARLAPLKVLGGRKGAWFPTEEAARLYRRYQIVLNENLFQGVTTRPLEVMASGGFLLTEAAPGSMDLYFEDGCHLAYFKPDTFQEQVRRYLPDRELRQKIAVQGRELVLDCHTLTKRASEILTRLEALVQQKNGQQARTKNARALCAEGQALLMAGLRWPALNGPKRVLRGAGRLNAAWEYGEESVEAFRASGLAAVALGRWNQALTCLARAYEAGSAIDGLCLGLALAESGQEEKAREILKGISPAQAGLRAGVGTPQFHLAAARLLKDQGLSLSPGFGRGKLSPVFWTALEHAMEAARLRPTWFEPWEMMGDLLWENNAPNEAHGFFQKALFLSTDQNLAGKAARTAREGYIQ